MVCNTDGLLKGTAERTDGKRAAGGGKKAAAKRRTRVIDLEIPGAPLIVS
jgi:hypothetical protein